MNISLNNKIPIIYDFLRVITIKHNKINFIENYANNNLLVDRRVVEALDYIWTGLDINVPGVALFFSREANRSCFMYSEFDMHLHEFDTINDLIDAAFNRPLNELKVALLRFYDNEKKSNAFYNDLLIDQAQVYSYINLLKIPLEYKWQLIGLFTNPEEILEPLKQFCHRVKRRLKNVYKQNTEYINIYKKSVLDKIRKNNDYFLNTEIKNIFAPLNISNVDIMIISYSLINEFLAQSYPVESATRVCILGVGYEKLLKDLKRPNKTNSKEIFLKALADKHRMQIIRLISNQEMYVGEISKKLKMVLSTTSYHLDILLGAQIIFSRAEGKKIYYKVNRKFISEYLVSIANDFSNDKF